MGLNAVQVRDAQHALNQLGLYAGPIDGVAGPGTLRGVTYFQQQFMLDKKGRLPRWVKEGELDEATLSKLIDAIAHHEYVPPTPVTRLEMQDARRDLLRTERLLGSWDDG